MGNFCASKSTILRIDTEQSIKVENVSQRKNILMYLLEKSYILKTEESKNRINEQLKEIFNLIKIENSFHNDYIEEKKFAKALKNHESLFKLLKIELYGLFDCSSYTELTRKIVINYYCSILLRDKNFIERFKDHGLKYDNKIEDIDPHFIPCYKSNEKLYRSIYQIVTLSEELEKELVPAILSENSNCLSYKFRKFINKFIYMMLLKKEKDNICIYNIEIQKNIMTKLEKTLKERCLINSDETEENEEFCEKMNYIYKKLDSKQINNLENRADSQVKFDESNLLKINCNNKAMMPKSTTFNINSKGETILKDSSLDQDDARLDSFHNNMNKKFQDKKSYSVYIQNNSSRNKKNSKTLKNYKIIYNGEIDLFTYLFSNFGTLYKYPHSKYEGTFKNGKKDGIGYKIIYDDIYSLYLGEWNRGRPHGHGIMVLLPRTMKENGMKTEIMKGKFKNGKFMKGNYCSIFEYKDNKVEVEKYKGELIESNYHSGRKLKRIKYRKSNFNEQKLETEFYYFYKGEYKEKLEHGKGFCIKSFPSLNYRYYYKGDFQNGKMHGEGIIIFEGNSMVRRYEGIFEEDKFPSQYGKIHFSSGDIFEGFFDKDNKKNEVGYYLHSEIRNEKFRYKELLNFNEMYEIEIEDFNTMNEKFSISNPSDVFFGQFMCDKKHGLGKYLFNMGLLVIGKYIDGEQNGKFETIRNKNLSNEKEVILDAKSITTFSSNSNSLKLHNPKSLYNSDKREKEKLFYLIENDEIIDKSYTPFKD